MTVAVILGSAFSKPRIAGQALELQEVSTPFGDVTLFKYHGRDGVGWVLFRHGVPHRFLPNQIPYRAHAAALREVGCDALLVTSSVGVLDRNLPIDAPLLVSDLFMPDNRLPDGSACSMYPEPTAGQAHLVLDEGLISSALSEQVASLSEEAGLPLAGRVVFGYSGGPRNKTAAENRFFKLAGAQVASMTVGPELTLANELQIPCAALVIGHKYSGPGEHDRLERDAMNRSLELGRQGFEEIVKVYLERGRGVTFANRIYRYGGV